MGGFEGLSLGDATERGVNSILEVKRKKEKQKEPPLLTPATVED